MSRRLAGKFVTKAVGGGVVDRRRRPEHNAGHGGGGAAAQSAVPAEAAMTAPEDIRDLLMLHLVPGLGPRLTAALLERFGSAAAVLRAPPAALQAVAYVGPRLAGAIHETARGADVDAEWQRLERH